MSQSVAQAMEGTAMKRRTINMRMAQPIIGTEVPTPVIKLVA
jgi:hypothetical protein